MTDLWADVRERRQNQDLTSALIDRKNLLADADAMYALLALLDIPGLSSWASNILVNKDQEGELRVGAAKKIQEAIFDLPTDLRTSL